MFNYNWGKGNFTKRFIIVLVLLSFFTIFVNADDSDVYILDGKLGVGVEEPEKPLEVIKAIKVINESNNEIYTMLQPTNLFFHGDAVNSFTIHREGDNLFFRINTTTLMTFNQQGLAIGDSLPANYAFGVTGNIRANGAITANGIGIGAPIEQFNANNSNNYNFGVNGMMFAEGISTSSIYIGYPQDYDIDDRGGSDYKMYIKGKMHTDFITAGKIGVNYTVTDSLPTDYAFAVKGKMHSDIITTGKIGVNYTVEDSLPDDYVFAVKGKILSQEIKVLPQENAIWPDYVFDKNHKLMDINALDNYIKENKHLPEIPSSDEVSQNGIDLGEFQAKILKKIEELTLYTIKLKKENDKLKKEIKDLKNKGIK